MAPNKFENHIKSELKEREIKPSSDAWMKLSDRLEQLSSEQPKGRGYARYAVVACFIGLIVLSLVFITSRTPILDAHIEMVDEGKQGIDTIDDLQHMEIQENTVQVAVIERVSEEDTRKSSVGVDVVVAEEEELLEQLVAVSRENAPPLKNTPEEIIHTKVLEVLAQVNALEQETDALTDAEVDSLLRKAQEEVLADKLFQSDYKVDAMALLSEVESELDKSFRDQIFESLKSGVLKVRTAVADRNN